MATTRRPHRKKMRRERFARLRLEVYTRDGFACVNCGWSPPVPAGYNGTYTLFDVIQRPPKRGRIEWRQVYWKLELDHVIPYSKGGPTTLENLQALCTPCNARKGNRV